MNEPKTDITQRIKKDNTLQDYCAYLGKPGRIFWINFIAGTARGLGFLVGATLIIVVVAFILQKVLSSIPIVGNLFTWLDLWLQSNLDSYKSIVNTQ